MDRLLNGKNHKFLPNNASKIAMTFSKRNWDFTLSGQFVKQLDYQIACSGIFEMFGNYPSVLMTQNKHYEPHLSSPITKK